MARRTKAKKKTAARRPKRAARGRRRTKARNTRKFLLFALFWLLLAAVAAVVYLDRAVQTKFEGKRWALPAHIYARPLELYEGLRLNAHELAAELEALGYRSAADTGRPATYRRRGGEFHITSRSFRFWDGEQAARRFVVRLDDQHVSALRAQDDRGALPLARLEPLLIGSIHPAHHEDRTLVRVDDVPENLISALLAIEDRNFYRHFGVDPRGLARALWTNLRARRAVQGGSTLTQQLVKNFYLTSERTLRRKLIELVMALSLEAHYQKDEILEAYLNEIYLGQRGNRAIHGFGLASQFYFGRPLQELELHELALLVGMIKGPSYYNPRRNPERALARRNLVLEEMVAQGFVAEADVAKARERPLGVTTQALTQKTAHTAFVDFVRRQLQRDYREEDLRSEGLQIFTTLDPRVQHAAEHAVRSRLTALEGQRGLPADSLQAAAVVTTTDNGEVLAIVGGRDQTGGGFNRALDARRAIGSLAKPAVYLTALQRPNRFTVLSAVDDSPLVWKERGAPPWEPQNFDQRSHGDVPLREALIHSYNIATARLGLQVGVTDVIDTFRRLGIEQDLPPFASVMLGAVGITPVEVAQMYQTLASGGFRVPLRAIRAVLTVDGAPLQRYPLAVEQAAAPGPVYLLSTILQDVARTGTAAALPKLLSPELNIAGKTGTSDEFRDSWFAGYTGDLVAVVWVGRDDNKPVGLTGAGGAMRVWSDMMRRVRPTPLLLTPPADVQTVWVDAETGLLAAPECAGAVEVAFIKGSAPTQSSDCVPPTASPDRLRRWFKKWFR